MTGWIGRWLLMVIGALAASACSMETAINAMSSAEDRQFAQDFVTNLKAGNEAWLSARMDPQVWAQSEAGLKQVAAFYPPDPSRTTLVGYHVATNSVAGGTSTRQQEFVLVSEGAGRWAVTEIATLADDRPVRVVAWRVVPHSARPPALEFYEASRKAVPYMWGLGLAVIAVLGGTLWAYLRYRRRKREAARARVAGERPW
jgi:hypothetical protein